MNFCGRGYDFWKGLSSALIDKVKSLKQIWKLHSIPASTIFLLPGVISDFSVRCLPSVWTLGFSCYNPNSWISSSFFGAIILVSTGAIESADTIITSYAPTYKHPDCNLDDIMTEFWQFLSRCPTIDFLFQHKSLITVADFDSMPSSDLMTIHAINMNELRTCGLD